MFESEVSQTFRTKYRENVEFLLQQGDSKLLPTVTIDTNASGELYKLTDQVGDTKARRKKGRNSTTEYGDPKHDGRWVAQPDPIYESFLVDKQDQLASGIELTGTYTKTAARAIARGTDDVIIGSIFGNAQTGKKGTILTPFDAGNVVPVDEGAAGPVGLTFDKINAAWEILAGNYVDMDMEELYMPITARQARQLRDQVQATSKDYAGSGVEIRDGKINPLVGFKFVHIELGNPLFDNAALTVDGNGYRKVPFYTKSGLVAAMWNQLFTSVDRLPQKHYSVQVYASRDVEATRTEEGKVGYILCDES